MRKKTEFFRETYRIRSKIERKIAELANHGLRQAQYIGTEKTEMQALWTGAAVNLKRLFKLAEGDVRLLRDALDSPAAMTSQPYTITGDVHCALVRKERRIGINNGNYRSLFTTINHCLQKTGTSIVGTSLLLQCLSRKKGVFQKSPGGSSA